MGAAKFTHLKLLTKIAAEWKLFCRPHPYPTCDPIYIGGPESYFIIS